MTCKRKKSDDDSSSEEEFQVAHIVDTRTTGKARSTQFLVMWEGYPEPTWEPEEHVQDTCALVRYLKLVHCRKGKAAGKASAGRAGRGASTEGEVGALKLSRREVPIARKKY